MSFNEEQERAVAAACAFAQALPTADVGSIDKHSKPPTVTFVPNVYRR